MKYGVEQSHVTLYTVELVQLGGFICQGIPALLVAHASLGRIRRHAKNEKAYCNEEEFRADCA